jgi:hypothetical protein
VRELIALEQLRFDPFMQLHPEPPADAGVVPPKKAIDFDTFLPDVALRVAEEVKERG